MKKVIFLSILIVTLISVFIVESCTKEGKETSPSITTEMLLADKDFQELSILENEIKSKFRIFDASLTSEKRKDLKLELYDLSHKGKNINNIDATRIAKILGYESTVELQNAIVNYSKQYLNLREKYKNLANNSTEAFDKAYGIAYYNNQPNLPWKFRRNKEGEILATPTNLTLANLGTLQLRSCNCDYSDCNNDYKEDTGGCDRDLRRDLRDAVGMAGAGAAAGAVGGSTVAGAGAIPGAVVGTIAGGLLGLGVAALNYDDCMDQAADSKCSCIKEHNPSCNCN